ncbi:MAG: NAD-dependent deacylase [Hydrotalea flava]|uniref:SIR2 family NAD-dependent protein deacylase n=1 Tax=Hydrotalea TaxID=1004300 RepID=UPI000944F53A|nr:MULTISPECIES: NAD-dependent deacylase [Hydrotalea]MBY0347451.1 NAD-dependent deacylase [Hydrotalea flava]NIM36388.1 NAD-dependent deacylase [Hydrotalea flava]NIM39246.1 NAD-dependent deacylase [Hydrotalea flava]NIN04482.1 NAD-dependent deacylase [Hydrotalea flava]NIN16107.1 NAD-dependent deacylase [Hydrotalea flava]
MLKPNIVVLTGAGVSAESGLKTFRDADGLWNGYDINEVATPQGFAKNPALVLNFYNQRRKDVANAQPNAAHYFLASLQEQYSVQIITQNIDDLHERAGSKNVLHLHGEIFKMRSIANPFLTYPIHGDIHLGDLAPDGTQLRPFIVWFNEEVPLLGKAAEWVAAADILIIIGTSLQVYPAAGLINFVLTGTPIVIIDKNIPPFPSKKNIITIEQPATKGVESLPAVLEALSDS